MQFTTIAALSVAIIGAFANPEAEAEAGSWGRPSRVNNNYGSNNNNGNVESSQTIKCGSNSGAYCCSSSYDQKLSASVYDCYSFAGSCNAITVCCNNNAQDKVSYSGN
jgi:hypothetical protein